MAVGLVLSVTLTAFVKSESSAFLSVTSKLNVFPDASAPSETAFLIFKVPVCGSSFLLLITFPFDAELVSSSTKDFTVTVFVLGVSPSSS